MPILFNDTSNISAISASSSNPVDASNISSVASTTTSGVSPHGGLEQLNPSSLDSIS